MNQDLNKGLIYNTQYLFGDYLNNFGSQFFNIPEYQRGYKWTKDNIIQLLEDIDHYQESTDSFYCLQNITIIPAKVNGEECFNVTKVSHLPSYRLPRIIAHCNMLTDKRLIF